MEPVFIIGAGSIGCLLAGHLRLAQAPVTLLLRSYRLLDCFQQKGNRISIDVHHQQPGSTLTALPCGVEVAGSPHYQSHIKSLIVTTKAQDTVKALQSVQSRLGPDSSILLLQNGALGVLQAVLTHIFPLEHHRPSILVGSVTHGAYRKSDFHVVHAGMGSIHAGSLQPTSPFMNAAAAPAAQLHQFEQTPSVAPSTEGGSSYTPHQISAAEVFFKSLSCVPALKFTHETNPNKLHQQLLFKLAANCCINPLTAIYGCKNGALLKSAAAQGLMEAVCSEFVETFQGDLSHDGSIAATKARVVDNVLDVIRSTSKNYSSMLQDVKQGRKTEVDFLTGYLVSRAKAAGLQAATSETLLALVKVKEELAGEG